MLVKRRQGWEMPESRATAEALYWRRRDLAKLVAAGPILLATGGCMEDAAADEQGIAPDVYPATRNGAYALDRPLTAESSPPATTTSTSSARTSGSPRPPRR